MLLALSILFFLTATMYAAVGFGGGSTYNALLVLSGVDYQILPSIALTCNIIVVTGGVARFWRGGDLPVKAMIPFLVTSIPAAWIGGRLDVSELFFIGLLGAALFLSGLRLAVQRDPVLSGPARKKHHTLIPYVVGGAIGFVSGIVGIGGGIFLVPILYFLNWDTPRRIAAACSLFILANSVSGLWGQLTKLSNSNALGYIAAFWPLMIAVLLGGQIGSWAASRRLQPALIKRLTAALILFVSLRLLFRWGSMMGWY